MIDIIPSHMKESLEEYVRIGRPTGGFLQAVLSNDFLGAFKMADDGNVIIMDQYARYIYNKTPMGCHGSSEIYAGWIKSGGLEGMKEGQ